MDTPPVASGTSYDEVPYESKPFAQSHPDRLAAVATMAALKPPPVERCRVLELGRASGGNLLPMAITLPNSTFVGIDLSQRQIAEGQKVVAELGVKNLELRHLSILDVTPEFGQFDYLLCHGIYSWVPPEVQDKILAICKANLSANGVAYVSYNTYPGWHMRGIIRDMMCYHGNHFSTPQQRVAQARALLDFVNKAVADQPGPYGSLLKMETELISKQGDWYLFHDHMERVNDPVYFHQFAERAAAKGLRYLGEAELIVMVTKHFSRDVQETLAKIAPDTLRLEQYMDFLRNRMFRQTLLCHQELVPRYQMQPEQIEDFLIASSAKAVSPRPNLRSEETVQFRNLNNLTLSTNNQPAKAALVHLGENWPRRLPFADLRTAVGNRLGLKADQDTFKKLTQSLGTFLFEAVLTTPLIELHVHAPTLATRVSERPLASPLARYQAATGHLVTTLHHQLAVITSPEAFVLRLLDGSRDRPALTKSLQELVKQGTLQLSTEGKPETDAGRVHKILQDGLTELLNKFAQHALLLA